VTSIVSVALSKKTIPRSGGIQPGVLADLSIRDISKLLQAFSFEFTALRRFTLNYTTGDLHAS
jgi:hypothetical protein